MSFFWQGSILIYHLIHRRFLRYLYQYMSFCRIEISLVDPVTQWDKCHLSLFYSEHEWKRREKKERARENNHPHSHKRKKFHYVLPSFYFSLSYSQPLSCVCLFLAREIIIVVCCSISFVSDWPMVNYCKCEWDRERKREEGREKQKRKKKVFCCCCTSSTRD